MQTLLHVVNNINKQNKCLIAWNVKFVLTIFCNILETYLSETSEKFMQTWFGPPKIKLHFKFYFLKCFF